MRSQAVVTFFDKPRGFGKATPIGGKASVFVHWSVIEHGDYPESGDLIEMAWEDSKKGPRATWARIVRRADQPEPMEKTQ